MKTLNLLTHLADPRLHFLSPDLIYTQFSMQYVLKVHHCLFSWFLATHTDAGGALRDNKER